METGAEALTGRDAEPKAVQETATQEPVEKTAEVPETPPAPSDEENDNKGTMKKAAIGALILRRQRLRPKLRPKPISLRIRQPKKQS